MQTMQRKNQPVNAGQANFTQFGRELATALFDQIPAAKRRALAERLRQRQQQQTLPLKHVIED